MKRLFVLLLAAFTFLAAPHIKGLRSGYEPIQTTATVAEAAPKQPGVDEQLQRLLKALDEDDDKEEAPKKITRPKLKPGEHWVVLIRFTNASVNKPNIDKVSALIEEVNEAGAEAIVLELNTLGGEVPSGYEFARAIERSHAPVTCVVDGDAASMGFFVLQSCDTRLMTKRSALMIHEPHIRTDAPGTQTTFGTLHDGLLVTSEAMLEHEVKRMKISKDALRQRIAHGQEWNMLYGEALEVGAIDGVADSVEWVARKLMGNPQWKPSEPPICKPPHKKP